MRGVRPTMLTAIVQIKGERGVREMTRAEYIVELTRMGSPANTACQAAGIDRRRFFYYLRQGRDVEEWLVEQYGQEHDFDEESESPLGTEQEQLNRWQSWLFLRAIEKARAEALSYAAGQLRSHMPKTPAAAIAFLERRDPENWRRRDQHEIVVADKGEDEHLLDAAASELTHAALRAAARGELVEGTAEDVTDESTGGVG